jgi:hypothetical protein
MIGKVWSVASLRLKAAASAKVILITRWRTSSKLTICKLSRPTTKTTTSCNKPRLITSTKTKLVPLLPPNRSDRFHSSSRISSPHSTLFSPSRNLTHKTLSLRQWHTRLRHSWEGCYMSFFAHSLAILASFLLVTTPPEIISYYRLNQSIWSLSDNKEVSRWVLSGLHPVNHLETQRGSNVCIKTPTKESPECLTN